MLDQSRTQFCSNLHCIQIIRFHDSLNVKGHQEFAWQLWMISLGFRSPETEAHSIPSQIDLTWGRCSRLYYKCSFTSEQISKQPTPLCKCFVDCYNGGSREIGKLLHFWVLLLLFSHKCNVDYSIWLKFQLVTNLSFSKIFQRKRNCLVRWIWQNV